MRLKATVIVTAAGLAAMALPTMAKIANNATDRLSYAIGTQTGQAFKQHDVQLNSKAFAEGIDDAMAGRDYQMSQKDITSTLMAFRQASMAKMETQMKQASKNNAKESQAFLNKNKTQPGVVTTESGLQYKVIKPGKGNSPSLEDTVTVNYEGKLINGKVFDSSYKRGKPVTFPVKGVIQGWQEALTKMKPGATWMLYIPSNLAYGERGAPGAIGPNEALIFKVDLVSVKR